MTNVNTILSQYLRTFETTDKTTNAKAEITKYKALATADFSDKDNAKAYFQMYKDFALVLLVVQNATANKDSAVIKTATEKAVRTLQKIFDFLAKYEEVKAVKATATDIRNIAQLTSGTIRVDKESKTDNRNQKSLTELRKWSEYAVYLHINSRPWPSVTLANSTATALAKDAEREARKAELEKAKAEAEKKQKEQAKRAERNKRKAEKAKAKEQTEAPKAEAPKAEKANATPAPAPTAAA